MKLKDIAKKIGSSLIREAVPGGSLLIDAVNAFLPGGSKLAQRATGRDLEKLPPQLLEKQFDIEIEAIRQAGETTRAMLEAEAKSTHSTRPRIALGAFRVIAFSVILVVATWAFAVISNELAMVETIVNGWPFLLALLGPLVGWLNAYFGVLRDEHKNRLNAVNGKTAKGKISEALSAILRKPS